MLNMPFCRILRADLDNDLLAVFTDAFVTVKL